MSSAIPTTPALRPLPASRVATRSESRAPRFRRLLLTFLAVLAVFGVVFGPSPDARADVQDFSYESWHVDADVYRDANGRGMARITETLVPRFPEFDQNRGLVLGKHLDYQGTSIEMSEVSVTDGAGKRVPFEIEHQDGFGVILTGDDQYVRGTQTYVISYTLTDVILSRDDGTADEFYWDLIGTDRKQAVDDFSATVHFREPLAAELNGNMRCYAGSANADTQCVLSGAGNEQDPITVRPLPLAPGIGLTVAVGLKSGSVAQPSARQPYPVLEFGSLVLGAGAVGAGAVGVFSVLRMKSRSKRHRGTVIAQYEVPDSLPPLLAAPITGAAGNAAAAETIHIAVHGGFRVEEAEPEQGFFGPKRADPVLRLMDRNAVRDPLDAETIESYFPGQQAGAAFTIPKQSTSFAQKMERLGSSGKRAARERGYFTTRRAPAARMVLIIGALLVVATVGLGIAGFILRDSGTALAGIMIGVLGLFLIAISSVKHQVHTELGAETREYLEGVRLFISVAEEERLRQLQSVEGAERREVDQVRVIEIYERLLPYAMLFKQEKSWSKALEARYETVPDYAPTWYPGVTLVGLNSIGSTINSFTSTLASSASYTQSSSGGSSGGGFVGGGGGGGFSGGR